MSRVQVDDEVKKDRVSEELFDIVDGLSVLQTDVLLQQALRLASNAESVESDVNTAAVQRLSKRELEVLVLVANGYNRKSIGSSLGISMNTAARHISNIYGKLGISTVAEATCFAYSNNVLVSAQKQRGIGMLKPVSGF